MSDLVGNPEDRFSHNEAQLMDMFAYFSKSETIRIFHECELLLEKSVPRVAVWHHEALPSDAKLYPMDRFLDQ